jgi:hypothetical protein
MGAMLLFWMLVPSPEACPKRFKIITMSTKLGANDKEKAQHRLHKEKSDVEWKTKIEAAGDLHLTPLPP